MGLLQQAIDRAKKNPEASLPEKMQRWVNEHPTMAHDDKVKMLRLADEMIAASTAVFNEKKNPKQLLGAWARARRFWCEITGEPLI